MFGSKLVGIDKLQRGFGLTKLASKTLEYLPQSTVDLYWLSIYIEID